MIELGWDQVLAYRLARHGLGERRPLSALEVSREINGIHAQVMSAGELSAGARSSALSPAAVQQSLWEARTFSAKERRGLAREVERLGHFLGASVTLG